MGSLENNNPDDNWSFASRSTTSSSGSSSSGSENVRDGRTRVVWALPETSSTTRTPAQEASRHRENHRRHRHRYHHSQHPEIEGDFAHDVSHPRPRPGGYYLTSRISTLALRRLLIRPATVVVFGFCVLQLLSQSDRMTFHHLVPLSSSSSSSNTIYHQDAMTMTWDNVEAGFEFKVDKETTVKGDNKNNNNNEDETSFQNFSLSSSASLTMIRPNQFPSYPATPYGGGGGMLRDRASPATLNNDKTATTTKTTTTTPPEPSSQTTLSGGGGGEGVVGSQNNPQMYGWEPTIYPNPLIDPVRCGIAYLPLDDTNNNNNNNIINNNMNSNFYTEGEGQEGGGGATPTATAAARIQDYPYKNISNETATLSAPLPTRNMLRLCDPDWVLGGMYLEQIASSLHTFSLLFGDVVATSAAVNNIMESTTSTSDTPYSPNSSNDNGDNGEWIRHRRLELLNPQHLQQQQEKQSDGTFRGSHSSRRLITPQQKQSQSQQQQQQQSPSDPEPDINDSGRRVELAVATVRKVSPLGGS
jgi:hypothetical protein